MSAESGSAICACCGEIVLDFNRFALNPLKESKDYTLITDALLRNVKALLKDTDNRPIQLPLHPERTGLALLTGLALQWRYYPHADSEAEVPAGIDEDSETIVFCKKCRGELVRGKLPARALANNLVFAPVPPELKHLSVAERQTVAIARLSIFIMNLEQYDKVSKIPSNANLMPLDVSTCSGRR